MQRSLQYRNSRGNFEMQVEYSVRLRKTAARCAIPCAILLAFTAQRTSAQADAGPMRPAGAPQASGDSSQPAQTRQRLRPMGMGSYPSTPVELAALEQEIAATLNARLEGWKDSSGVVRKPKVVVLDFCPQETQWLEFGAWLADNVSANLSRASQSFEVIDRVQLAPITASRRFGSKDEICSHKGREVAQAAGADLFLMAKFVALDKDLGVTLNLLRAFTAELQSPIYFAKPRVAMSKDMTAHVGVPFDSLAPPLPDAYYPGVNGVSLPKCLHCPAPPFSPEARNKKISGVVVMLALITGDGRVGDLKLKKSLEPSLDESAMETVSTWRFEPARDADGVPVSVHFPIEVSFRSD